MMKTTQMDRCVPLSASVRGQMGRKDRSTR